ncbi:MAG: ASKHA domain-containing protein [Anaerolineaceae bacterium]|nr:ASKHA domain-containing protein [Anaerolineaceae bacterium]
MAYIIEFEPVGRRGECADNQSLLDCARQLSVDIISVCGGVGACERCKVQVVSGQVTAPGLDETTALSARELAQGYRLACQAYPLSDVKVHVPPESLTAPQRTQVEGLEIEVEPQPPIRTLDVQMIPPTLHDPRADDRTLWAALAEQHGVQAGSLDLTVQQNISQQLRSLDWKVRLALRENEIVAIGSPAKKWLGLAVDIGTTKIAGYLIDMETGKKLASKGLMNPQISYGEDVVSRIAAASRSPEGAAQLQKLLTDGLSQMAADLCAEIQASVEEIVEAVVVGNTAIHHLFLKLPVRQLGNAPYVPAVRAGLDIKARDLGLRIAPGAYVHLLPNIAGYVGADHVAMLLATQLAQLDGVRVAIDIGTNTEICLNSHGKMTSVSCASGPAFEGAHIKYGMRAAPGAIEHLRLSGDNLDYQTIGGAAPVGVCGSGLLDTVAQLFINGVLDRHGRMGQHSRVRTNTELKMPMPEFVIVSEAERGGLEAITISQHDVRVLQLAKAAIRMGIQALVEGAGLKEEDIDQIIVAGAFGTFIDVESAVKIGMFPDIPLDRYIQVGNAAGTGARLALISLSQRAESERIAQVDDYIELASIPGFNRKFAEATYLV